LEIVKKRFQGALAIAVFHKETQIDVLFDKQFVQNLNFNTRQAGDENEIIRMKMKIAVCSMCKQKKKT
jgi:hypothetical protein